MLDDKFIQRFYNYLDFKKFKDPKNTGWLDIGLVDSAPSDAVIAFDEFKRIEEKSKKEQIDY